MGTYTTNYNLFMPSVGEQGWGELVNGNFSTIDSTMKNLSNSIGTIDTDVSVVEERVTTVESRLGTGTYIANAKVPIVAKLSTTNEGYGWVSNGTTHNSLVGFHIVNPNDTYTVTFRITWGANDGGYTFYGINLLTGESRTISSISKSGYNQTSTATVTLYVVEGYTHARYGAVAGTPDVTSPVVYINVPE